MNRSKLSEIKHVPQIVETGEVYVYAEKTSEMKDMDIKHPFTNPVIAEYTSAGVQKSGYIIIQNKL